MGSTATVEGLCFYGSECTSYGYSGYPQQSKNMHMRSIKNTKTTTVFDIIL